MTDISMKYEELLKKAIEKAVKNGLNIGEVNDLIRRYDDYEYVHLIYRHDFAKAFWGNEVVTPCCGVVPEDTNNYFVCNSCDTSYSEEIKCPYAWQFHLQQMVIEENPIKYLERFL